MRRTVSRERSFFVSADVLVLFVVDPGAGEQMFEEYTLQMLECKQADPNNQLIASSQEQLMGSARFFEKGKKKRALRSTASPSILSLSFSSRERF